MLNRIIFIDSQVIDYQSLLSQLPFNSEAIILKPDQDGLSQICAALQDKTGLDAIDIISHGKPGALLLGSGELNNANLLNYAEQLEQVGMHMSDTGDILLYGCEVAQGKQGRVFIEQLSDLIGANVAASTNLTGAAELGADWVLEARTNLIYTPPLQLRYQKVLALILGTSNEDVLVGTSEDDEFWGFDGDDRFISGPGADSHNGGSGWHDRVVYANSPTGVVVDLMKNKGLFGYAALDDYFAIEEIEGSAFDDTIIGSDEFEMLFGNDGNDLLMGNGSGDSLYGDSGNDILVGGAGGDDLYGGPGIDTADYRDAPAGVLASLVDPLSKNQGYADDDLYRSIENLSGSDYDDTLIGDANANTLDGRDGNDILNGGPGYDKLIGGLGHDTYILDSVFQSDTGIALQRRLDTVIENSNEGIDQVMVNSDSGILFNYTLPANVEDGVITGAGVFSLTGNALDNRLTGNSSDNTLRGLDGGDILNGRTGNDRLIGGLGDDVYILNDAFITGSGLTRAKIFDAVVEKAGEGFDGIEVSSDNGLLSNYTLGNNVDWGVIAGDSTFDLNGNASGNLLRGNEAANRLSGEGNARGNDTDVLFGNGGNDWLVASSNGQDELNGGEGADQFIFSAIDSLSLGSNDQLDEIVDFGLLGAIDNVNVFGIDAKASVTGNNSFTFIGSAPFTAEGQISATQVGADAVLSLNTNGSADAEMQILLSDYNAASLTLAHFVL